MEEMKEKMRKFVKFKQQKILELEEENDWFRVEVYFVGDIVKECMEIFFFFNVSMKEEFERVKMEYEIFFKKFQFLMFEKDFLSEEV